MRRVGWVVNYRGMGRVPPSRSLYPFMSKPARRRPAVNSLRVVRRRRGR